MINMESKYKSFDELPLMLSVPEAAEVLGISAVSLYKLIRDDNSFSRFETQLCNTVIRTGDGYKDNISYAWSHRCRLYNEHIYACDEQYAANGGRCNG